MPFAIWCCCGWSAYYYTQSLVVLVPGLTFQLLSFGRCRVPCAVCRVPCAFLLGITRNVALQALHADGTLTNLISNSCAVESKDESILLQAPGPHGCDPAHGWKYDSKTKLLTSSSSGRCLGRWQNAPPPPPGIFVRTCGYNRRSTMCATHVCRA